MYNIDLTDIVNYIHTNTDLIADKVLVKDNCGKGYVCPVCGAGSHSHKGTGLTKNKGTHTYTCWANCALIGKDIIEIYGRYVSQKESFFEQVKITADVAGIPFDVKKGDNKMVKIDNARKIKTIMPKAEEIEDYTDFIITASNHLHDTPYWSQRGLSEATMRHFGCGYCQNWVSPKAEPNKSYPSPRFIIPTDDGHYVARDTTNKSSLKVGKAGSVRLFNKNVLFAATPKDIVFVVDGEIDAMSFYEVGCNAVSLGGVAQADMFVDFIVKNQNKINCNLILALDNDKVGQETQQKILNNLFDATPQIKASLHQAADVSKLYCGYKDANDALMLAKEDFKAQIDSLNPVNKYLVEDSILSAITDFVADTVGAQVIPTGFDKLDKALDGGLTEGLYFLGGISSLGKTSLMLQMANQMANQGNDVLFFSLEQSKRELISKILSRLSYDKCGGNESLAKTTNGFMIKSKYKNYTDAEVKFMQNCIYDLGISPSSNRLKLLHSTTPYSADDILNAVKRHYDMTGHYPIVFADYLQILAAQSDRLTDKQSVDRNVFALKSISAECHIPVFATSSLNRDSYNSEISLKSFKESGAVEYSSDVLIGLQFRNLRKKLDDTNADSADAVIDKLKAEKVREVELAILKNRNGITGIKIPFNFVAMFNSFSDNIDINEQLSYIDANKFNKVNNLSSPNKKHRPGYGSNKITAAEVAKSQEIEQIFLQK